MTKALGFVGAAAAAMLAIAWSAPAYCEPGRYESPPVFSPAQILPPNLVRSPYHTIVGRVTMNGFLGRFQMQTKYGTFPVEGIELLRMRVREVAATAELEKIGGAETLVGSAGRTALKPLGTAKDLVTAPGKTIGETVQGIGGWFGRVDASMEATDPGREKMLPSLTGGSKARRKLAYQFGIDPYTTFPPLDAELTRVASASAIGETGVNVGLAFVTGGAGIAISVGGTTSTIREVLRDKTAGELEKFGRQQLPALGVSQPAIDAFYATSGLTPTDKAVIVAALMSLGGAGEREIFIRRASRAGTYSEGFFYRREAELIAAYHKRVAPISSFFEVDALPMVQTAKGAAVIAPIDYLYWSEPLARLVAGTGARQGTAWITGGASKLASSALASRGWNIVPKASQRLER